MDFLAIDINLCIIFTFFFPLLSSEQQFSFFCELWAFIITTFLSFQLIHVQTFGSGKQTTFLVKHQGQAYKLSIEPRSPHIFHLIILGETCSYSGNGVQTTLIADNVVTYGGFPIENEFFAPSITSLTFANHLELFKIR